MTTHVRTVKVATLVLVATAAAAATTGFSATRQPGRYEFASPSGNIVCAMHTPDSTGQPAASCEIAEHDWVAPPESSYGCSLAAGSNQFRLDQGEPAGFACMTQHLPPAFEQPLDYGATRSIGSITCASEPSGMTCADAGTGHYFRVSEESYDIG